MAGRAMATQAPAAARQLLQLGTAASTPESSIHWDLPGDPLGAGALGQEARFGSWTVHDSSSNGQQLAGQHIAEGEQASHVPQAWLDPWAGPVVASEAAAPAGPREGEDRAPTCAAGPAASSLPKQQQTYEGGSKPLGPASPTAHPAPAAELGPAGAAGQPSGGAGALSASGGEGERRRRMERAMATQMELRRRRWSCSGSSRRHWR
jgi:hypothetical protein